MSESPRMFFDGSDERIPIHEEINKLANEAALGHHLEGYQQSSLHQQMDACTGGSVGELDREPVEEEQLVHKYKQLLSTAPNALFLADMDTGEIIEVNDRAVELTGYTRESLCEMNVVELSPTEQEHLFEEFFVSEFDTCAHETFDNGCPVRFEMADRSTKRISLNLNRDELPAGTVVQIFVRDVSERRECDRKQYLQSQALEQAPVGITIVDGDEDGLPIVSANAKFSELTGYSEEAVVGENCQILQGDATRESTIENMRAKIEQERHFQEQILNYRADGTPFWNRVTISPASLTDADDVTHYVGIQEDVTGRNRRDKLVNVLNRVIRHNLRNTMGAISGFAGLIADDEGCSKDFVEHGERIQRMSNELLTLSEKAKDFQAGISDDPDISLRDAVPYVQEVVSNLEETYPETEFVIEAPQSVLVMATEQLKLVLEELGDNAAKYGDSAPVTYSIEIHDESVSIHVIDDGPGLPETEVHSLETGKETPLKHGSGLGLWLVNWAVTSMGGDVDVDVSDGTTVSVNLPVGSQPLLPDE